VCSAAALAQIAQGTQRTIRASGDAQISVAPDMARVQVAVVTRAATADEASAANATRTTAVINAIRQIIGATGEVRTAYYNVTPYSEGNPPRQAGFQVTNSVAATVYNIGLAGRVVDAAIAAGANRVDTVSLGLRDDDPVVVQALRAAGQRARARAEAIAQGLGLAIGRVLHADEGATVRPVVAVERTALGAAAASTPIEAGTLTVSAAVTVEYEIM
jgi:uncharacterized protein YggE